MVPKLRIKERMKKGWKTFKVFANNPICPLFMALVLITMLYNFPAGFTNKEVVIYQSTMVIFTLVLIIAWTYYKIKTTDDKDENPTATFLQLHITYPECVSATGRKLAGFRAESIGSKSNKEWPDTNVDSVLQSPIPSPIIFSERSPFPIRAPLYPLKNNIYQESEI